jgi:hypothetical protein
MQTMARLLQPDRTHLQSRALLLIPNAAVLFSRLQRELLPMQQQQQQQQE